MSTPKAIQFAPAGESVSLPLPCSLELPPGLYQLRAAARGASIQVSPNAAPMPLPGAPGVAVPIYVPELSRVRFAGEGTISVSRMALEEG